jgi:hypothetical protein
MQFFGSALALCGSGSSFLKEQSKVKLMKKLGIRILDPQHCVRCIEDFPFDI